ncbi:hypothetical protein GO308_05190 [Sphingomonas sp. SFZ2018-12]|uniref:hypothetical protein n=1 Tax=Sphingomonas sp. SFZ2018-12 TaxID=2683197 RepID=UPI001F0FDCFD|nr:hypothetical protein [Sphingomonas sp. SFZ2018-12]MCH4892503.1 hypothetical protein [Sphingomonas sp. SFZ2018-12]
MSTRISSRPVAALLLALAGCDPAPPEASNVVAAAAPAPADRIACADPGSDRFTASCTLERREGPEGAILVVTRGDGGFHRLRVSDDGRGVVAADGAEPARVRIIGDKRIEVAIGGARYQLPATIAAGR